MAESLKTVSGWDDLAPSACGALVSETAGPLGAASLDLDAYLAAGRADDHFSNPFAALVA
jgi:hypothetical protein